MPPAVGPRRRGAQNECTVLVQCTVRVHAPSASSLTVSAHCSPWAGATVDRAKPLGVFRRRVEDAPCQSAHCSPWAGATVDRAKALGVFRRRVEDAPCQSAHCSPWAGATVDRAKPLGVFRWLGRGPPGTALAALHRRERPVPRQGTAMSRHIEAGSCAQGVRRWIVRGNGIASRKWWMPQSQETVRSRPRPKPECGKAP